MKVVRKYFQLAIAAAMCVSNPSYGEENQYLEYSIPKDAEVTDQYIAWGGKKCQDYYLRGSDRSDLKSLVAKELFENDVMVERKLYDMGKLHGVQRTWHLNGQLKSESPYLKGVRHGTFKHWDEKGNLIGKYNLTKGVGKKMVFDSNGVLRLFESYLNNKLHGLRIERPKQPSALSWGKYEKGKVVGVAFAIYPSGDIQSVLSFSLKGEGMHGPAFNYKPNGEVYLKGYYLHGEEVNIDRYIEESKKNSQLPYFKDPQDYKKLLSGDIKKSIAVFKSLELVKIPLELKESGNPLTKSGKELIFPN